MTRPADGSSHVPGQLLRQAAVSGAKWSAASTAVVVTAQTLQVACLARILEPSDFGRAAAAMVLSGLAYAIGDLGFGNAIIAKQATDRRHLSSLYWANVSGGVVIAGVIFACIPLISAYFRAPDIGGLVALAALTFAIAPFGQQFQALLQRDLQFERMSKIEAAAAVGGALTAISLALIGSGAASIVGGYLATAAFKAALLMREGWSRWRPAIRLRWDDVRPYASFGLYQSGGRLIGYFVQNVDYILIGRLLGTHALGVYAIAYQLIVVPQLRLFPILMRTSFPLFARRQTDDAALRRGFLEMSRLIALVTFPIMCGMAVTAEHLVPAAFGSKWSASVPIVQIESLLGVLLALGGPQVAILLAKDRPGIPFAVGAIRLPLVACAIWFGVNHGGLSGAAWGYVSVMLVTFVASRMILERIIGLSPRTYAATLLRPAVSALVMGGGILAATPALTALLDGDAHIFLAQLAVGISIYGTIAFRFERDYIRSLLLSARPRAGSAQIVPPSSGPTPPRSADPPNTDRDDCGPAGPSQAAEAGSPRTDGASR